MFGIGLPELAVILLVSVVVFGPDKLPDLARQAAHLVRQLKSLADGARDELRAQLGPEYADLELRDLDPRTVVRRHLTSALEDDWERAHEQADDPDDPDAPGPVVPSTPLSDLGAGAPVVVDLAKHQTHQHQNPDHQSSPAALHALPPQNRAAS